MRQNALGLVLIGLALLGKPAAGDEPAPQFPPPAPPKDESALGLGVQRTMHLLASSTPEHRNPVRILFYGQSITEQDWSKQVAADLKARFPHADLEIENRAIGGFASQLLIRPAEHDLYPFYPDLLIFHVYGANGEYEQIIKATRGRTTAEVLMQKDHVTQWPPEVIDEKKDKGMWWDNLMNHHILPDIASKYGCGLVDIRGPWLDYLRTNHFEPKDLLKDGVHLNDRGNSLMAALVSRYLVHRPDLPDTPWRGLVRTFEVGDDLKWEGGKLTLDFQGNRVDALPAPRSDGKGPPLKVLIDGKAPSEAGDLSRITRPQPGPWSPLTVTRVDRDQPLVAEDWTLKVTSVSDDSQSWTFKVSGSKTGPDGGGSNGETFVSKSGRVKIEPAAWFRVGKVPVGYEITWHAVPMYVDTYAPPKLDDPTREHATTLAQGLTNDKHRLELVAEGRDAAPIRAIRVYRPPVK